MASTHSRHPLAGHLLWDRRRFLKQAVAAGVLLGPGLELLTGCADGGAAEGGGPSSSSTTLVPVRYDDAEPYWMQGNYAPVHEEVEAFDLDVTGSLPPELDGLYVRNGSNPAGAASPHWFLGDGMVHGVRLGKGKAEWYRNRYVQTPLYAEKADFLGGGAPGGASNQSNVSVFGHAGRLLSSGEVGLPYEIDPEDLSTVGVHDFDGALHTAMTAHPKIDPSTGRMHFFGYGFVPPFLTYHVAEPDGRLTYSAEVAVPGATMIHDFAITDQDVVFWDLPVVFDLDVALAAVDGKGGASFPYRWDPSYGARIGIMPLGGPTSAIRWVEIEPCYVFHGVNAHRSGDEVVIDVCRLPSMFTAEPDRRPNSIQRWRVDTSGAELSIRDEVLSDRQMDLPAIDRRRVGLANRQAWYLDVGGPPGGPGEFTGLTRRDERTGALDRYDPGERMRMNEGTFVPASPGEGEGWLLAYGWDRARGKSDLLVFDALEMKKGPVAAVHLPARVPYGFHGWWVPQA